jgi:probable addiction module antidote protein
MIKTAPFDVADYLDNPKVIAHYIREAFETGDIKLITRALGAVARARGMATVANRAGLSRENLYRALGEKKANPEFVTVLKVIDALDLQLTALPKGKRRRKAAQPQHETFRFSVPAPRGYRPRSMSSKPVAADR